MEIYNATDSVENNMMLSQNIKNEITIWLGNSIFEYIPKRTESRVNTQKNIEDLFVHPYSQQHYTGQKVEATQVSMIHELISKMWYIHKGILFSLKNEGNSNTCYIMYKP